MRYDLYRLLYYPLWSGSSSIMFRSIPLNKYIFARPPNQAIVSPQVPSLPCLQTIPCLGPLHHFRKASKAGPIAFVLTMLILVEMTIARSSVEGKGKRRNKAKKSFSYLKVCHQFLLEKPLLSIPGKALALFSSYCPLVLGPKPENR